MYAPYFVCLIVFIFVYSTLLPILMKTVGIPNFIPLIRDFLLCILAFSAFLHLRVKENKLFYGVLILISIVLIINVFIAILEDRQIHGLYYARFYALPVLFIVAFRGHIFYNERKVQEKIIRLTYLLSSTILIVAIFLYIAVQIDNSLMGMLVGGDISQLPVTWFIAGGWIRMGLPMTAPNHLGLVVAFLLIFLMSLKFSGKASFLKLSFVKTSFFLMGCVLALTFSRSSWLATFFGIAVLLLVCRQEWNISTALLIRIIARVIISLIFLAILLYYVDIYSEGIIARWVSMNFTGTDPSMVGHGNSFIDAYEKLHEYYLYGYPRGSVGSRALVAEEDMKHVENTIFIIFYDMGVFLGTIFIILSGIVLVCMFRHPSQIALLAVFFVAGVFLPYVQAPEIVISFLYFYSILGCLVEQVKPQRELKATNKKYRINNSIRKV